MSAIDGLLGIVVTQEAHELHLRSITRRGSCAATTSAS